MSDEEIKVPVGIKLTNGEIRYPGQVIPKSHVKGTDLSTSPKLAKGKIDNLPKGERVLVSGESYLFNRKEYYLMKEYGVVCIYNNGWLTPILRDTKDREKETLKVNIYHPFKKTEKVGPDEIYWPTVEELC